MKHVDGVLGWGGESWLYDRDFCKFFFFFFHHRKCERAFDDSMMN